MIHAGGKGGSFTYNWKKDSKLSKRAGSGTGNLGEEETGTAIGVTFQAFSYENDVNARIEDGVTLYADSLEIDADNTVLGITLGASGGESKDYGINGVILSTSIDNTTI